MDDDGALAAALSAALGDSVRLVSRRRSPYASSFPLDRLVVEVDGARRSLMFKDVSPGALLPAARRARGVTAGVPSREPAAYGLLGTAGLGTATCVAAVQDAGRAWIFLEAV